MHPEWTLSLQTRELIEIKKEEAHIGQGLFYMEKKLEDFIIENWNKTEFGKKYDLIEEEGELISQQFKTDIGFIDILAKDKKTKNYVVFAFFLLFCRRFLFYFAF